MSIQINYKNKGPKNPLGNPVLFVDENFNIIDEFNEKCRLRDGVIPSPVAMLITKTDLEQLSREPVSYTHLTLPTIYSV